MSLALNLNSLVKFKKIKQRLDDLPQALEIGTTRAGSAADVVDNTGEISGPLKLEILTYDDAQDVVIKANDENDLPAIFRIKTAETAKITDSKGKNFDIDEIIYSVAP